MMVLNKTMRRIAAVIPYKIYPYNSGGQKSIALFYHFFSKKTEITLICTSNNTKPADAAYTIAPLLGSSVTRYINPFLYFTIKPIINKNKIDVIVFEQPYFGWLAFLLKKLLKVKIIIRSHNIEGLRFKSLHKWWWKILWHYEKWAHSIADFTFFIQQNDKKYAVANFKLDPNKTAVITSGITWNEPPTSAEKENAKRHLKKLYNLSHDEAIIFFNGAFDYKPNKDALEIIVSTINPELLSKSNFRYKIIVCGRNIPEEILKQTFPNIILAGFAEDIDTYYKGSDIFINPVNDGGGIKTKLVEALGFNLTSVSTVNGAIGIDTNICNGKLLLCGNSNYNDFSSKIIKACAVQADIGKEFYQHFYWGNIIDKAIKITDNL